MFGSNLSFFSSAIQMSNRCRWEAEVNISKQLIHRGPDHCGPAQRILFKSNATKKLGQRINQKCKNSNTQCNGVGSWLMQKLSQNRWGVWNWNMLEKSDFCRFSAVCVTMCDPGYLLLFNIPATQGQTVISGWRSRQFICCYKFHCPPLPTL